MRRQSRKCSYFSKLLLFSHAWFATPQEVLHADWQEVWHSPQPLFAVFVRLRVSIVLILFIIKLLKRYFESLLKKHFYNSYNTITKKYICQGISL